LRIPKKKELLELQKKYRTDKKIGEIYGVPARLVAYWRSKKNISAYSFPKYSEEKIRDLWERFGNDSRAGEELNISKAGFRQWRRKYKIENKPLQLRLEQLELSLPDSNRRKVSRRETISQKILARKSGLKKVEVGEIITIEPDLAVTHENSGSVYRQFAHFDIDKVWEPNKIAIVLDQHPGNFNGNPARKIVRDFARKQKIKNLYDFTQGIGNQLILESALISPGQLILSTGGQSACYGSLGTFAADLSVTEMAAVWAAGRIWLKIPETIKITLNGHFSRGVFARDIALKLGPSLIGIGAEYKAVEFYGTAVSNMSIPERLSLVSVSGRVGLKSAIVPFDDLAARYLRRIARTKHAPVASDSDACYCHELEIDVTSLTPQAGSINGSGAIQEVEELNGKKVEQVVLGCCSNGRLEDLEIAAKMLRGRQISRELRMMIIPSSHKVFSEALDRGYIKTFVDSGCTILNPGCWSCVNAHEGSLEPGERAVTTALYSCAGRAALSGAEIYQVSPATAAATALEGTISDPRRFVR
jgi:3-isopropylmalate/(R)-2-methylmalate dehydratase large subunit